jgi:GNAT superfamily N-acetyltransferase
MTASLDIRELRRDELGAAARLMTGAFIEDPGWLAVGPDRRRHRRLVSHGYHRAVLAVTRRHGGPIYGAFRDRRLAGIAATFGAGRYPAPGYTFAAFVPSFVLAGPAPSIRGLRFSAVQERWHPEEEHVYLWFLAVDPAQQRGGVGRALIARVYEDADGTPVYLDTANPANVPYYASNGFALLGEEAVPRGGRLWAFQRR